MKNTPRPSSILFLKENNGWWVALWLETNIASQGHTIRDAWAALRNAVSGQLVLDAKRGRSPFQGKTAAPDWYRQAYERARPLPLSYLNGDEKWEPEFAVEPRQLEAA